MVGELQLKNSEALGTPIYHESANIDVEQNILVYHDKETGVTRQLILYRSDEQTEESSVSFIVTTPQIDTKLIAEQKYVAMLKYVIDRYRLANKTYIIKYD